MAYLDTKAKRERIQDALNQKLQLDPKLAVDGNLGPLSAAAIIKARSTFHLDHIGEPVVDTDLMRELGLLTIQDPTVQAAGSTILELFIRAILPGYLKGLPTMNFLTGYKTFIIGGVLIVLGAIELLGWQLPGVPLDPSQGIPTIMTGIGLITGRVGAKTEAKKAIGG